MDSVFFHFSFGQIERLVIDLLSGSMKPYATPKNGDKRTCKLLQEDRFARKQIRYFMGGECHRTIH
jgi:hypothetical protein